MTQSVSLRDFTETGFLKGKPLRVTRIARRSSKSNVGPFWLRPFQWAAIAKERRDLLRLDDNQLQDIGLSKSDVAAEARRPSWDIPNHWHN